MTWITGYFSITLSIDDDDSVKKRTILEYTVFSSVLIFLIFITIIIDYTSISSLSRCLCNYSFLDMAVKTRVLDFQ